jgi:transposase-like protein
VKGSFWDMELEVPRDRNVEFEPAVVKKDQTTVNGDIEEKIISMYAKGMTQSGIEEHIRRV